MTHRILILVLLLSSTAYAQGAEDHAQRGQASYDTGQYDDAIASWNRALELAPNAVGLIFNIAQAQRLVGRCLEALASYEKFISLDQTSAQRPTATQFAGELREKCGAKAPTTSSPKIAPPAPTVSQAKPLPPAAAITNMPKGGRTKRLIGVGLLGAGAGAIAVGIYFGGRANAISDEVSAACQHSCVWTGVEAKDAQGRRFATYAWSFAGVGTAVALAGVAMFYLGEREATSLTVTPTKSGGVISWSRQW